MAWLFGNYVLGLAARPSPNKVSVITGRDSHAGEKKKVLFIGSHRLPVAAGTQDWCRGDTAAPGRKLLLPWHVFGENVAD